MLQGAPAHDSLFLPDGAVGVFTVPQDWAVARTARQGTPLKSDVDRWAGGTVCGPATATACGMNDST
jgi:hypothetical protein